MGEVGETDGVQFCGVELSFHDRIHKQSEHFGWCTHRDGA